MSIKQASDGIYKDKGSKFIAKAFPVKDLEEIKNILVQLKLEHPKARHVCYAYRLGFTLGETRSHDDGEPSGSARKPIQNTLFSFNVHFCFLAVVRYFGGTLLGVPGLIQAYKEASANALLQAEIVTIIPEINQQIIFNYEQLNEFMKIIKKQPIKIVSTKIDNLCIFDISYPIRVQQEVGIALEILKI
jgi:putative IMPACT (imprinted ancient) family translation regulator